MDTRISNEIPYSYLINASVSAGRVSIPVSPAQLPYANFKHVGGVASGSFSAYSLDKLRILDTLIDRLKAARNGQEREEDLRSDPRSEAELDALIQHYGGKLHEALAENRLAYARPEGITPGMLLSMAA